MPLVHYKLINKYFEGILNFNLIDYASICRKYYSTLSRTPIHLMTLNDKPFEGEK